MILHHSQYFINVQYSKGVDVFTVNLEVSILDTSHGLDINVQYSKGVDVFTVMKSVNTRH